jgi:hypothetical protein
MQLACPEWPRPDPGRERLAGGLPPYCSRKLCVIASCWPQLMREFLGCTRVQRLSAASTR